MSENSKKETLSELIVNKISSTKNVIGIIGVIGVCMAGWKYFHKKSKINSESLGYDSLIPFTVKQSSKPTSKHENSEYGTVNWEIIPTNIALKRSENYYKFMNMRRSVRFFRTDIIPDIKTVINCIKTANTAPSGAHLSPWTFVLIKSPKLKKLIRIEVEKEEQINYERRMKKTWVSDVMDVVGNLHSSSNIKKPYIEEAPYIIIVMKQMYRIDKETNKKLENYYPNQSTGIAAGILFTALHNANIATLPSTPMGAEKSIRMICKRPQNEKVFLLMPCGYPHKNAEIPYRNAKKWRKNIDDALVIL